MHRSHLSVQARPSSPERNRSKRTDSIRTLLNPALSRPFRVRRRVALIHRDRLDPSLHTTNPNHRHLIAHPRPASPALQGRSRPRSARSRADRSFHRLSPVRRVVFSEIPTGCGGRFVSARVACGSGLGRRREAWRCSCEEGRR